MPSAAAEGMLWVAHEDVLHRLDARGQRLERLPAEALGLPSPLLHLHAVRADDILASAGDPMRLYRCVPSQRRCRLVDRGYVERFGGFKLAVWIGANADGSRVVVSDNARHRLAVLDAEGALIAHAGDGIGRFHFPGQPVWVGEQTVWLAGADAGRIERFEVQGDRIGEPTRLIPLRGNDAVLKGRSWSLALAPQDAERWWAVIQHDMIRPGGLFAFSTEGRIEREADLPPGADLTAVARLADQLVVADLAGPRLWRLSLDGRDPRAFGDAAFSAELESFAAARAGLERTRRFAQIALVAVPIVGVLLLLAMGERPQPALRLEPADPAQRQPPGARRIEIGLTDAARKEMKTLDRVLAGVMLVFAAAVLAAALWQKVPWSVAAVIAVGIGAQVAAQHLLLERLSMQRLIVEHGVLQLLAGDKELARAKLADCWTDGRTLLVAGHRVMLATARQQTRFDAGLVREHVLAAIPAEQRVSTTQLEWGEMLRAWRRRPLLAAAIGVATVAVIVWALADILRRGG